MRLKAFILIIIGSCLFLVDSANAGFGISPYEIKNEHLLRGNVFTAEYMLSRSADGEDQALAVSAVVENEALKPWITIDPGFDFSIPLGMEKFPVKITVKVPANAALGDYRTKIHFNSKPEIGADEKRSGMQLLLGVAAELNLKVIDKEFRQLAADTIRFSKATDLEDSVLSMRLINSGNLKAVPTKAVVVIKDLRKELVVSKFELADFIGIAPPFSSVAISRAVKHNLTPGYYWAEVQVFDGDKLIGKETTSLEIFPNSDLQKALKKFEGSGGLIKFFVSALFSVVIAGALVLGGLLVWILAHRK